MKNQYGKVSYWVAGAVLLTAFSGPAFAADKITVFAAASLTNALQDIAVQYKTRKAGRCGGFLCVIFHAGTAD